MVGFLDEAYLWVKALHIIAVIAWMAGMLYLPRLFIYHCAAEPGSVQSETFKVMERRLLRAIINPAMVLAWILGLALATDIGAWGEPWMHAKLTAVIALSTLHGFFARWRRDFDKDENRHSARFYRIMNEVPTVLMIAIVLLVVLRPF
jgi:putative membrane protein